MKAVFPMLLLLALDIPALAQGTPSPCSACSTRPAPGPIMGAGLLPVLLIGGGFYWWTVRRKKTPAS